MNHRSHHHKHRWTGDGANSRALREAAHLAREAAGLFSALEDQASEGAAWLTVLKCENDYDPE